MVCRQVIVGIIVGNKSDLRLFTLDESKKDVHQELTGLYQRDKKPLEVTTSKPTAQSDNISANSMTGQNYIDHFFESSL